MTASDGSWRGWSAFAGQPTSRTVPERRPAGFGRVPPPTPDGPPVLDDAAAAALLPERSARGHKATFGKLLVLAGSLDYAGAAVLVCRSAGRAGAGLVTLAVPESLQPLFASRVVEATSAGDAP